MISAISVTSKITIIVYAIFIVYSLYQLLKNKMNHTEVPYGTINAILSWSVSIAGVVIAIKFIGESRLGVLLGLTIVYLVQIHLFVTDFCFNFKSDIENIYLWPCLLTMLPTFINTTPGVIQFLLLWLAMPVAVILSVLLVILLFIVEFFLVMLIGI